VTNGFGCLRCLSQISAEPTVTHASWDVDAAVIAAREALVVVQRGERALDDAALRPEPGTVLGVALGDPSRDPAIAQHGAVAAG
jgi:hypothetical protein